MSINSRNKGASEIWKPVWKYEGLYEVSSLGRVRSLKRFTTSGKVLKIYTSKHNGYCYVSLSKDNKRTTKRVHKLVIEAFNFKGIVGYDKNNTVNHINGDKTDNRIDNLEWVSQSVNQKHAFRKGLQKVTWNKPVIRLEDGKIYDSITEAAEDVNGQRSKIALCCNEKRRKHKGYGWAYLNDDFNYDKALRNRNRPSRLGIKVVRVNDGRVFNSITEAALALNCSSSSISRVCSGKQKQTKGMVFKYADDDRR